MTYLYCPYTDRTIRPEDGSIEHIVPKALGGAQAFSTGVDRTANSRLGSMIDGRVAADLLLKQRRNEQDVRGHSRKRPIPRIKGRLDEDDLPVQLELDKRYRRLGVFSPRDGRYLRDDETAGKTLSFRMAIDPVLYVRFAAKVALASGYLAYGTKFLRHSKHKDLRQFMWEPPREPQETPFAAADLFNEPETRRESQLRALTEIFGSAVVVLVPSSQSLTVAVGCLGRFIALVSVDTDTNSFPNTGSYELGRVYAVREGRLATGSVARALRIAQDHAARMRPDQAQ